MKLNHNMVIYSYTIPNVRWLSKGLVLQRFFAILDEIKLFLSSSDQLCAKDYLDGEWSSEATSVFGSNKAYKAALQMEIIEFQEDMSLKEKFTQVTNTLQYDQFWMKYVCSSKYPELKRLVLKLCTIFGSTYVCEAAFSKMNFIKNNFRSRLTDEHLNLNQLH